MDKKAAEKFYSLAKNEEFNHNYQKAFEYYTQAIKISWHDPDYYYWRALLRQEMQDYVGAIQDYTESIRLGDKIDSMDIYFNHGYVYHLAGNDKQAKKEFLSTIEIYPDDSDLYALQIDYLSKIGEYKEAFSICNKLIKLHPNQEEWYIQRAEVYLILKDFKQAIRDFSKAIKLSPNNEYGYRDRGSAYLAKGDYLEAIQDFTKAIELKVYDSEDCYRQRGDARYHIQDFTGAIEDHTIAIKRNSHNGHIYNNRGRAYCASNQRKLATEDFALAASLFTVNKDWENAQKAINLVIMHRTEADIKHQKYINSF